MWWALDDRSRYTFHLAPALELSLRESESRNTIYTYNTIWYV